MIAISDLRINIFWDFGFLLFYTVAAVFIGVLLGSSVQRTYGTASGMVDRMMKKNSKQCTVMEDSSNSSNSNSHSNSHSSSYNSSSSSYNRKRDTGVVYREINEQSVDRYIAEHEPGSRSDAATATATTTTSAAAVSSSSSSSSSSSKALPSSPRHVAVIMDGNRRFGQEFHNDPLKGHWSGGETLGNFCEWCLEAGVEVLTVYAFSTENWGRTPLEISTLMTIFAKYALKLQQEAQAKNVRVRVLSTDPEKLPDDVRKATALLEERTAACDGFLLNICLSYGSRDEIVQACKAIAKDYCNNYNNNNNNSSNSNNSSKNIDDIDEVIFGSYLKTSSICDPDILIRTSGEHRISNFLLYQMAYTELFFIDKYWPEVTRGDLHAIFSSFAERKRRYGK